VRPTTCCKAPCTRPTAAHLACSATADSRNTPIAAPAAPPPASMANVVKCASITALAQLTTEPRV